MRWILLGLVTVNLGYFAWNQWRPGGAALDPRQGQQGSIRSESRTDLVPLRLVNETAVGQAERFSDDLGLAENAAAPRNVAVSEQSLLAADDGPREGIQTSGGVSSDNPTDEPGSYLQLVQASKSGCVRLGPFVDVALATRLLDGLRENELSAGHEALTEVGRTVFWVHLPPAENRQEAVQNLRDLQNRGVDSFLIERVEAIRNGISLGVFNERGSAVRHQEYLRRRGLEASIFADPKPAENHYVTVTGPFASGEVVRIASTLENTMAGDRSWRARRCAAIASANAID